ncbi:uncharacterized protein LOC130988417 [Salvia miltiorrhiza]|uniref:uncharacterized protein LOC130988417 n=1 Tax=Salvia miltiorrhiza TaxID=226208 RepID=UPI0025AD57D2|nr:uncharacterized protein LOC130988417 [Salvia miltiorrhiza]
MFGTRLNLAVPGTYDSFAAWEVPEGIYKMIKGECGSSMAQSWMGASQIIVPCVISEHYVIVRIHPGLWQADLFDPKYHGLDEQSKLMRADELQPLLTLFSRVLESAGYWATNELALTRKTRPLQIYIPGPEEQFTQKDLYSSGPFACMIVERIISGQPSITWGDTRVNKYRELIAASIFDMGVVDE